MPLVRSEQLCQECKVKHIITLPDNISEQKFKDDMHEVKVNGKLIQNQLPYLNENQRELLITGYCDEAWYKIFGDAE